MTETVITEEDIIDLDETPIDQITIVIEDPEPEAEDELVSEDEEEVEEIPVEPEPVVEEEEPIQEEEIVEEPPIVEETPKPQIIDLDEEKIQEIQQNELVTDQVVDEPSEDQHVVSDSSTVQPEFIKPTPEELPEKPEDLPEEREPIQ